MASKHLPASQLREDMRRRRRRAWGAVILSLVLISLWEFFGGTLVSGQHPDSYGFRFSPMYLLQPIGFIHWLLFLLVLVALGYLQYAYMGRSNPVCCPDCNYCVSTKDDWVCPHCEQTNTPTYGGASNIFYTVLTRCRHCGHSPGAYQCPQCGTVYPLEPSGETHHYAYRSREHTEDQNTA